MQSGPLVTSSITLGAAEDGKRSLEFVSAVYASARESKPIELLLTAQHASYDGWGPT